LIPPAIIECNPHFCVLDKPSGWTVQESDDSWGLLRWARAQLGGEVFPVHRLDKPTTGLVLMARNAAANRALSMQFQQRLIRKQYLAISDQKPSKKQGSVIGDMVRSRRGQWKLARSREHPAITRFTSVSLAASVRGYTLLPQTGKTHQLRVAMKSLSSPIIGDKRYGGSEAERLYLHAHRLAFDWQGRHYSFEALPQGHWFELWRELGLPDGLAEPLICETDPENIPETDS
jgi:tRNA pseudouridine32 synthase/23S rRNA pseudouridine746 synthase